MKKILNNKGMTLVEIILSIGLVSIVMVQVLNILVDLKDEQLLGKDKTKDLTNRSVIMKTVQEDFMNRTIKSVYKCVTPPVINEYDVKSCVEIVYDASAGSVEKYDLITAKRKNSTDDTDYFIYGQFSPSVFYEAWPLASGYYPVPSGPSKCGYIFEKDTCPGGGNGCNGRFFKIYYPVTLSVANENTSMVFDLEFLYYFRSTVNTNSMYQMDAVNGPAIMSCMST